MYIDFTALGGLLTHEDGTLEKVKISTFAARMGVHRDTFYKWQKNIPDFWDLVKKRRLEIGSMARTNKVWAGVYLRAAQGDAEQAKLWLSVHDGWQPPSQKHELELGDGMADLLSHVRNQRAKEQGRIEVQEAEVVSDETTDNQA